MESNTSTTYIQYQPLLYPVATKFPHHTHKTTHYSATKTINKWDRDLQTDDTDAKWKQYHLKYATLFL